MKKIYLLLAVSIITFWTTHATNKHHNTDKPFIFIENNVEYAIFQNGDFDFNVIHTNNSEVSVNSSFFNISFNTGHNYSTYIVKNKFGEVTKINNTPIYYDYRGRVNRIGSVRIYYNRFGFVDSIGSLHVYYNTRGVYDRCNGYVNHYNKNYKPYCSTYIHPRIKRRVLKRNTTCNTTTRYTPRKQKNQKYLYQPVNRIKAKKRINKATKKLKKAKRKKQLKSIQATTNAKNRNYYNTVTYTKRVNSNSYRR